MLFSNYFVYFFFLNGLNESKIEITSLAFQYKHIEMCLSQLQIPIISPSNNSIVSSDILCACEDYLGSLIAK